MANTKNPKFIGLGGQKCGTSWASKCFVEHPQLWLPIGYIVNHFNNKLGPEGYLNNFPTNDLIKGEINPSLHDIDGVAENIYALDPNLKVFIILREPTQRAVSQYQMEYDRVMAMRSSQMSFQEFFEKNHFLGRIKGYYDIQVEPYLKLFGKDNFKVLLYDDIVKDPLKFIQGLYEFVGADRDFEPPSVNQKIRVSRKMDIPQEAKDKAKEHYRPHVEKLEKILNIDLSHWKDA